MFFFSFSSLSLKPKTEIAKHICGKTFLDIDMSYLMAFQNDLALTYTDKRKLAHAIKSLRTVSENMRDIFII